MNAFAGIKGWLGPPKPVFGQRPNGDIRFLTVFFVVRLHSRRPLHAEEKADPTSDRRRWRRCVHGRRARTYHGGGADGRWTGDRKEIWHRAAARSRLTAVFRCGLPGISA